MKISKVRFRPGTYFYIYQKAENKRNLFPLETGEQFFLNSFQKAIKPYATLTAYCLLRDHYHFLIKVKEESTHAKGYPGICNLLILSMKRFLRDYNLTVNKLEKCKSKLLSNVPHVMQIHDDEQLKKIIAGIHLNPVYHKLSKKPEIFKWSSFGHIIQQNNIFPYEDIYKYFGGEAEFIDFHCAPLVWCRSLEP